MEFIFEFDGVSPEARLAQLATMKPTTGFGETFQYSNALVSAGGFAAGMQAIGIPGSKGPMTPGEAYKSYSGDARENLEAYRQAHPVVSTALEIGGAIPTAMLPLGIAARGAGLAGKAVQGAKAGALYGGLYGAGTGEGNPIERLPVAAVGAGTGDRSP